MALHLLHMADGPQVPFTWPLSDRASVGGNQVHGVQTYMSLLCNHYKMSPPRLDSVKR